MRPPPEATWHAAADGIGHAVLKGPGQPAAICGAPRQAERFDHPIAERCPTCSAELHRLVTEALRGPEQIPGGW